MRLEGFEIEGELGRGAQATVYRVREVATGSPGALKVLASGLDPETLERFERERAALALLGGEGVVAVRASGASLGRPWLLMDLMAEGSLRDRLKAKGRLEWREATEIALRLARTLARAHGLGLVHRDVKPTNVLFDASGEPRLADFGVVRDLARWRLTETGTTIGTLAYMAPEAIEGKPVSGAADVFSLGVVLHEMLAGERPFEGATLLDIVRAMRECGRPRIADGPKALDLLLDKALALDPGARPSARDLALGLEELLAFEKRGAWPALVVLGLALTLGLVAILPRKKAPPDLGRWCAAQVLAHAAVDLNDNEGDRAGLALATAATDVDPSLPEGWVAQAQSYRHLGYPESARAALERALALDDRCTAAHLEHMKQLRDLVKLGKASLLDVKKALDLALAAAPDDSYVQEEVQKLANELAKEK